MTPQIHWVEYNFHDILKGYISTLKFPGKLLRVESTHDSRTGHGILKCFVEGSAELPDSVAPLVGELALAREAVEKLMSSMGLTPDSGASISDLVETINKHLS